MFDFFHGLTVSDEVYLADNQCDREGFFVTHFLFFFFSYDVPGRKKNTPNPQTQNPHLTKKKSTDLHFSSFCRSTQAFNACLF